MNNFSHNICKDIIHSFGKNAFKLYRLPIPQLGKVIGLVGTNGIGKSTALYILSNKFIPNFGHFDIKIEKSNVLKYFRASEL